MYSVDQAADQTSLCHFSKSQNISTLQNFPWCLQPAFMITFCFQRKREKKRKYHRAWALHWSPSHPWSPSLPFQAKIHRQEEAAKSFLAIIAYHFLSINLKSFCGKARFRRKAIFSLVTLTIRPVGNDVQIDIWFLDFFFFQRFLLLAIKFASQIN